MFKILRKNEVGEKSRYNQPDYCHQMQTEPKRHISDLFLHERPRAHFETIKNGCYSCFIKDKGRKSTVSRENTSFNNSHLKNTINVKSQAVKGKLVQI